MAIPENWVTQLRKGILELCLLNTLCGESRYGYEIVRRLALIDGLVMGEGTVYPILSRLKREGFLTTSLQESDAGPPRQYYELTPQGRARLEALHEDWAAIVEAVQLNLEPENPQ